MNQTFEWRERGHKWYYFNTATGKIAGTVNKQALDEIWIALVYTGQYTESNVARKLTCIREQLNCCLKCKQKR